MTIDGYTATQLTAIGMKHYYTTERNKREKIQKLEYLSGLTVDELVVLFAAGYTLEPPKSDREIVERLNKKYVETLMKHPMVPLERVEKVLKEMEDEEDS